MFKGDSYLPGVLVVAYSIKLTNTIHDIVCMVTPDVTESARAKMRATGIIVHPVKYLSASIKHKGQRTVVLNRYPDIHLYTTKWQCLSLVQYDKVFLLDVDMVILRNIDHIFNYTTPSTRVCIRNRDLSYTCQKTGSTIDDKTSNLVLYKSGGSADGSCMLLKPGVEEYKEFLNYLNAFNINKFKTTLGDDELIIFSFYISRGIRWHALDSKWSCVDWKDNSCNSANSNIMNYIGLVKPWKKNMSAYSDLKLWYETYHKFKNAYPGMTR
jgi:hypothetical protein